MPADVAEAGGAEHRVGDRVADHVGVGVAERAALGRDRHAAEHQRPALDQPMQIVAGADRAPRRCGRRPSASRRSPRPAARSSGVVILMFDGSPSTRRTAMAGALGQRRLVGRVDARRPARARRAARRGGTPAASARDRSRRAAASRATISGRRPPSQPRGPLHRVARLHRRQRRAATRPPRRSSARSDRALDERPRRVVNHDDVARSRRRRETRSPPNPAAARRRRRAGAASPAGAQIRRRIGGERRPAARRRLRRSPDGARNAATLRSRIGRPPSASSCLGTRRRTAGRGRRPR